MANTYKAEFVPNAIASMPDPFNILLLSEAFREEDEPIFNSFTEKLADELFKIPPFHYCKEYINIFRCFISSNFNILPEEWNKNQEYKISHLVVYQNKIYKSTSEIDNLNKRPDISVDYWLKIESATSFGFFIKPGNSIQKKLPAYSLLDYEEPKNIIENVSLEGIGNTKDIFFDSRIKSFGAICIIINNNNDDNQEKNYEINYGNYPAYSNDIEIDSSPYKTIANLVFEPIYRYFWIDLHGNKPIRYETESSDAPINVTGKYLHSFAHELAHSFGLADEYPRHIFDINEDVKNSWKPKNISPVLYEDFMNNHGITDPAVLLNNGDFLNFLLDNLKWKSLMSENEKNILKNGNGFFPLDVLRPEHETNGLPYGFDTKYPIPNNQKVHWFDIYTIEGGVRLMNGDVVNKEIFRSNFECKMKNYIYGSYAFPIERSPLPQEPTSPIERYEIIKKYITTNKEQGSPDFCRICNNEIKSKITGFKYQKLGNINRHKLETIYQQEIIPRIIKSFQLEGVISYNWIFKATTRSYLMFIQLNSTKSMSIKAKKLGNQDSSPIHLFLDYNGLMCDPVFYDLYRLSSENIFPDYSNLPTQSPFKYLDNEGGEQSFINKLVTKGVIGTTRHISLRFLRNKLRDTSIGKYNDIISDSEIADYIFNNNDNLISDPLSNIIELKTEWDLIKNMNFSRYHHKPLDMDKPLKYVLNL